MDTLKRIGEDIMLDKTVEVTVEDLLTLKECIVDNFVVEDQYSCDSCMFCGSYYGNYNKLIKNKVHIHHESSCPVLLIQDMTTRL